MKKKSAGIGPWSLRVWWWAALLLLFSVDLE
jgi:hypothetical protein